MNSSNLYNDNPEGQIQEIEYSHPNTFILKKKVNELVRAINKLNKPVETTKEQPKLPKLTEAQISDAVNAIKLTHPGEYGKILAFNVEKRLKV